MPDEPAAPSPPPITALLQRVAGGDRAALDAVYASLYPDLKRIASARLHSQGDGDALQTTVLVHESFLRLAALPGAQVLDRKHFFAYAARTMRSVIVDSARARLAERRGGHAEHVTLGDAEAEAVTDDNAASDELVRVNDALGELEVLDAELAAVVEMRYFGGYAETEIADLLGVNERTVRRRWEKARAWLYVALGGGNTQL
jgi:RNA polymerase sigma factor (TIGR02999 family)